MDLAEQVPVHTLKFAIRCRCCCVLWHQKSTKRESTTGFTEKIKHQTLQRISSKGCLRHIALTQDDLHPIAKEQFFLLKNRTSMVHFHPPGESNLAASSIARQEYEPSDYAAYRKKSKADRLAAAAKAAKD